MKKKNAKPIPENKIRAKKSSTVPSNKKRLSEKTKGLMTRAKVERPGGAAEYRYEVVVIGKGQLSSVVMRLNAVAINLKSNSKKEWKGSKILPAGKRVKIHFECSAPTGTGWTTGVTNKTIDKSIHDKSGETGANNWSEYDADVSSN